MTRSSKKTVAIVMLALAAALLIGAALKWQSDDKAADDAKIEHAYARALGVPVADSDADHTPSVVMMGAAALLAVGGVIFVATLPAATEPSSPAPS